MNDRKKKRNRKCSALLCVLGNADGVLESFVGGKFRIYSGTACNLVHDLHGGLSDGAAAVR